MAKVVLCTLLSLALARAQLFDTPLPRFQQQAREPQLGNDQIVDQVLDTLSPTIAQAVADALRGLNSGSSGFNSAPSPVAPPPASSATPAQYEYEYKVASDKTQTYISQQESRDGLEVVGTYSYVDPTGAIVTVRYTAGVNGYEETRERQEGAVKIVPAAPRPERVTPSSTGPQLDSEAIIRQVLAALQPAIRQSVQSVVSNRGF